MNNITWQDLSFFLTRLKNLPVSKNINLGDNGGFCVSTGCDFESWVYYPERVRSSEVVERAIKFFRENKISFVWPLYDGGEKFLEDSGLLYAGSLTGMIYEPMPGSQEGDCNKTLPANEWARIAWRGFGGEVDGIPENYYKFVDALGKEPSFTLSAYMSCGSYLLVNEPDATGVYYFATVPEMRRKGVARAMMNVICGLSKGKKILLQSTPSGLPFYKSFGFVELCKIPVYSDASDVF